MGNLHLSITMLCKFDPTFSHHADGIWLQRSRRDQTDMPNAQDRWIIEPQPQQWIWIEHPIRPQTFNLRPAIEIHDDNLQIDLTMASPHDVTEEEIVFFYGTHHSFFHAYMKRLFLESQTFTDVWGKERLWEGIFGYSSAGKLHPGSSSTRWEAAAMPLDSLMESSVVLTSRSFQVYEM